MQKALYPEGESCCHAIVVHPPAGIASGDSLTLEVSAGARAAAVLATPGATRWYRCPGLPSSSTTRLTVAAGATLEWLPREAIVFDGARASARLEIDVAADGRCVGWDIWCLGRVARGERFEVGRLELETRLRVGGRWRWEERGVLEGGSALLRSPAGLGNQPVFATLWAAGAHGGQPLVEACRAVPPPADGRGAVSLLPEVLLARYLGRSTEDAFNWLSALWSVLRPMYLGRTALRPRIWAV